MATSLTKQPRNISQLERLKQGVNLVRDQPELMFNEQAMANAIIGYAIELKEWDEAVAAISLKIEQQKEFVASWAETVSVRLNAGTELGADLRSTLSRAEAEERTGITHQQVSNWRKWLRDADRYRDVQFLAACRKAGIKPPPNHRAIGTGENEWYTPDLYLDAARQVLGRIDLDPASSDQAQTKVRAAQYFTLDNDGLKLPWHGNVWLNPPYMQPYIAQFMTKMVEELTSGRVSQAIMLTHNYTDTEWFHAGAKACSAICFTRGRIKFYDDAGNEASPTQGQAFFYFGRNDALFDAVFRDLIGFVVCPAWCWP